MIQDGYGDNPINLLNPPPPDVFLKSKDFPIVIRSKPDMKNQIVKFGADESNSGMVVPANSLDPCIEFETDMFKGKICM